MLCGDHQVHRWIAKVHVAPIDDAAEPTGTIDEYVTDVQSTVDDAMLLANFARGFSARNSRNGLVSRVSSASFKSAKRSCANARRFACSKPQLIAAKSHIDPHMRIDSGQCA